MGEHAGLARAGARRGRAAGPRRGSRRRAAGSFRPSSRRSIRSAEPRHSTSPSRIGSASGWHSFRRCGSPRRSARTAQRDRGSGPRGSRVDESALGAVQRAAPPQLDPDRALPRGQRGGRRDVPRLPRHDQLRLGLVPDAAQAAGHVRLLHDGHGAGRALPGPRGRGAPPSCARCAPRRSPTRSARPATTSSWRCTPRRCASSAAASASAATLEAGARGRRLGRAPRRGRSPRGMAMFDDRGFYKRAQIVAADLALAGVARFRDLDRLTIFADNLVPHVLRCDGVLVYDAAPGRAHRRRARCCAHGSARSARSAPAPCTPASCIAARARRHRRARSTTGCGTAGRRRSTRRARGTAAATVFY